jgi:hypothetical protein
MKIEELLDSIKAKEKELKKLYPANWRVKIQNAKSLTDMQINSEESQMKWNHYYLDNLRKQL